MSRPMTVFRWIFEDRRTGRIIVAQMPNALVWLFTAAFALAYVLPRGWPASGARLMGFVGVALWGLDEMVRGVNPWRRMLGGGVLAGLIFYIVRSR